MAGGFAALAGAATLASPNDAAKKAEAEQKGVPAEAKPQKVKEHVPASAFDHLDEQEAKGSGSAAAREDDETRGAPVLLPNQK
jgi:hypothetical protein